MTTLGSGSPNGSREFSRRSGPAVVTHHSFAGSTPTVDHKDTFPRLIVLSIDELRRGRTARRLLMRPEAIK